MLQVQDQEGDQQSGGHYSEERPAGDPGNLLYLRHQGIQDRQGIAVAGASDSEPATALPITKVPAPTRGTSLVRAFRLDEAADASYNGFEARW